MLLDGKTSIRFWVRKLFIDRDRNPASLLVFSDAASIGIPKHLEAMKDEDKTPEGILSRSDIMFIYCRNENQ